ncbi:hypothetical protein DBR42_29950 [Pelomonas sp. HMWF004]|nr:hypothetical protein DBR42_29950 [Pelomonas sp. HMWF004]
MCRQASYLAQLSVGTPAQFEDGANTLGAHNDAVVALSGVITTDRDAFFAVGWLTAKLEQTAIYSRHASKALDNAQRFWR